MSNNSPSDKYRRLFLLLLPYLPVLLAILIMLPRLASPQFGLFDDGNSIVAAQHNVGSEWGIKYDALNGRFRPVYWLAFTLLYQAFGEAAFVFFFVNTLVLCITTAALIMFLRRINLSPWQAGLSGLFFVLSGPVIENYYTLSKGEWLQVLFIALSLVTITYFEAKQSLMRKVMVLAGTTILLLFTLISKETSIIMLPISAAWLFIGWVWSKRGKIDAIGWRSGYFASSVLAAGCFFVLRFLSTNATASTQGYTDRFTITVSQIAASLLRWAGWLTRDFAYLAILIALLVAIVFVLRKKIVGLQFSIEMLVWMAAWVAIFLPWNYMTEYYMLPFAFGAAGFAGVVIGEPNTWNHTFSRALGVIALIVMVFCALNNFTTARIQLSVDSVNAQLMKTLSLLPKDATIFLNIQIPNEYTDQIERQLDSRFNRSDINIQVFDPANADTAICASSDCYVAKPFVENQPLLTVRMGLHEPSQAGWNESLTGWLNATGDWQKIEEYRDTFRMMTVDFPRVFCPVIQTRAFCATPAPLLDTRPFTYGWALYHLETP